MNSRKPPIAPAKYRPQTVPKVLQTKKNMGTGLAPINRSSPRILQLSKPGLQRLPVTAGRASVIQRAAQAGAGSSGRSASVLWGLFCSYRRAQADTIEAAFLRVGYDAGNVRRAIETAITSLRLDLPAHGFGDDGGAVQGDLEREVSRWVSTLTTWATQHPVGKKVRASGLEHNEEQRAQAQQAKQEHKMKQSKQKKQAYCDENGHQEIPGSGVCKNCGQEI